MPDMVPPIRNGTCRFSAAFILCSNDALSCATTLNKILRRNGITLV
jgi:hypothetical protein